MIGKKKFSKEVDIDEVAAAEEVAAPVAAPVAASPSVVFKKYKVKKGGTILWAGCITTIPVGADIDESGYGGASGIAKLLEAGLELELIS